MSASLDSGCETIVSKQCGNYNYFSSFNDYWWLVTANSENTNEAFAVSWRSATNEVCSEKSAVKPVIKISSSTLYDSGDGSYETPYLVKFY